MGKKVDTSRHALSFAEQEALDGPRKTLHQVVSEVLAEFGLKREIEKVFFEGESSKFRMMTDHSVEGTLEIDSIFPIRTHMEKEYHKKVKHARR